MGSGANQSNNSTAIASSNIAVRDTAHAVPRLIQSILRGSTETIGDEHFRSKVRPPAAPPRQPSSADAKLCGHIRRFRLTMGSEQHRIVCSQSADR